MDTKYGRTLPGTVAHSGLVIAQQLATAGFNDNSRLWPLLFCAIAFRPVSDPTDIAILETGIN